MRYALILTTGALAFLESAAGASLVPAAALILSALASNIVLSQQSPFSFFDAGLQAPVLVSDTAMISLALLLTRANQEFFFFFFFILIMAAKLDNLVVLGIGAALIGFASFLMADTGESWVSPALMRIPFLLAAGIFFGYVVLPERTGDMQGTIKLMPQKSPLPRPRSRVAIEKT